MGLATLALALASSPSEAAQWKYALGVHNIEVRDVDSNTYGIGGHAEVDDHCDGSTSIRLVRCVLGDDLMFKLDSRFVRPSSRKSE